MKKQVIVSMIALSFSLNSFGDYNVTIHNNTSGKIGNCNPGHKCTINEKQQYAQFNIFGCLGIVFRILNINSEGDQWEIDVMYSDDTCKALWPTGYSLAINPPSRHNNTITVYATNLDGNKDIVKIIAQNNLTQHASCVTFYNKKKSKKEDAVKYITCEKKQQHLNQRNKF